MLQARGNNPNGQYETSVHVGDEKFLGKKSKHVTKYYYIWKDGVNEGREKKVSGCRFFSFRHPLANFSDIMSDTS